MKSGWIATCVLISLASGCSPAVRQPAAADGPAPQAAADDPEYRAAVSLLAAGPVDRYVPLGWLDNGRKALGSVVDATDLRGNPAPALLWADLAGRGVIERPDSDLVFEILSEHVRIANHALASEHGRNSLDRLRKFSSLDPIRAAWVAVLAVQSKIAITRMPDGSFSTRYWSSAMPEVREEIAAVEALLGPLTAPQQADRPLFDAWLKLRIAWASILCDMLIGEVAVLSRTQPDDWKSTQQAYEKRLHQAIWYVPAERFPSVTALLYLKLARFHRLYGEVGKATDDLNVARKLVTQAKDLDGIARVDVAEADSILTPGCSVEMLGARVGGPDVDSRLAEPPPDIRPPEPETVWRERADKAVPLLLRAEATFRTVNNPLGLSATRIRRGYIEARLGNYDEAAEFYRQAEAASASVPDSSGQALAWFHLVALHLSAGEIGRAQQDAQELFKLLQGSGLTPLAAGMGEALLGMAGREMTRFGTPNQRLAVMHLSARCFEVANQPLLTLRHHVSLLKLAAHFGYIEILRFYAARVLAAELVPATASPGAAAGAREQRCIAAHVLAAALLRNPLYATDAVEPAQTALRCVLGAPAPPVGLDPDETRLTAALALAAVGRPDEAYPLLPGDDPDLVLQVAARGGQTRRLVELARKSVAEARAALDAEMARLPPPPEVDEGAEPPPPEELPEEVKTAKAILAEELVRLAGALLDDAATRGPTTTGKPSPEAEEAQMLLGEWKSLGIERSALDKRPWEALSLHGRLAAGLDQPDAAWMFFSGAFQLLLDERDRIPGASRKAAFTRSVSPSLRRIQSFLLAYSGRQFELPGMGTMNGASGALWIHEDLKAHALAGLLVTGMDYQARLLDPQDGLAFSALGQRMRNSRCEEEYWAQAEDAPPGRAQAARSEHENVEVWLDQAVRDLGRKYPALAFARGELPVPATTELVQLAAQRRATFVVYAAALVDPYAWIVSADGIRVVRLGTSSAQLGLLVQDLLTLLAKGTQTPAPGATGAPTGAMAPGQPGAAPPGQTAESVQARLYELLIQPLAPMLPAGETVAIVPDGPLHSLPFGVLSHGGIPFAEEHPYFVVPTITLAAQLASRGAPALSLNNGIFVEGDPLLAPADGTAAKVRLLDIHAGGLPQASAADSRCSPLADRFSADSAQGSNAVALGAAASEISYAKLAPEAGVLHLSAPLLRFAAEPMHTGLLLARSEVGDDDGLLQAWELAARPLRAALVVVEATQEASGLLSDEEALAGVARGFFTAGVPVVVTNLLPVSPEASAAFFARFYESLGSGTTVSRAVRDANLALRSDPRFSSPATWGAFVAVGLGDLTVSK